MQITHRQTKQTEEFYTISVDPDGTPIKLIMPTERAENFFSMIADGQLGAPDSYAEDPQLAQQACQLFMLDAPDIIRGSLPDWKLISVGVSPYGCLLFQYYHAPTHSTHAVFSVPQQSFSILLDLPLTAEGPTPPCQISQHYWLGHDGYELCTSITEYFGTFTRHTQLLPIHDEQDDFVIVLDITEIRGY